MASRLVQESPLHSMVGEFQATDQGPLNAINDLQDALSTKFKNDLILGGQFIRLGYEGKYEGIDYSALGLLGLDEASQEWVEFFGDSKGIVYVARSKAEQVDPKIISLRGEWIDPETKEVTKFKSVYSVQSEEDWEYSLIQLHDDGSETVLKSSVFSRV